MSRRLEGSSRFLLLGVILGLGAVLRFWGIGWGLHDATISRRPHPDEWVVYWLFQWFDQTHSLSPCPGAPARCFFDWGTVYPYAAYAVRSALNSVVSLPPFHTFGRQADLQFVYAVLAGRITSAILSTATILAVYGAGCLLFDVTGGLLAALVIAASALPIQLAHFATPDSTVTFLVAVTLYALARALAQRATRPLIAAGALIGLATGAEYHMLLLSVPLIAAWLLLDGARQRHLLAALGLVLGVYLASNVYTIIDWGPFSAAMRHTLLIRTVNSSVQYQGRFDAYGPDWLYLVRYPLGYGVGIFFTLWLMAAVAWGLVRRASAQIVLLSWIIPYGLVVSISVAKFMRYSLPLMPALAILAGGAACRVLRTERRQARVVAALALTVATVYSAMYDVAYSDLFSLPDARLDATQWLEKNVAPRSVLAFEQLPNGLVNLPYFASNAGYRPCFTQFQPRFARGPIQFVLTDSYALEEHPRIPRADVLHFRAVLHDRLKFRVATRFHNEPQFLGMTFPIDASPHDWRYPSRDITVFERVLPPSAGPSLCYPNLNAALAALYPRRPKT
ncbi:MAG: hypothetical protein NVSMB22_17970 [Chloroflexota bacterium]